MVFHIISLGLGDAKDITVRGLELIKGSERVYLECYTAILGVGVEELEKFYDKKVIVADRHMVERDAAEIMRDADKVDVSFLVVGDCFAATTHHDIYLRAIDAGIPVNIVHNASIMNAVACCGLQLYTFGVTVSIPYFDGEWRPYSFHERLMTNYKNGMHTLCLVDIKVKEQKKENIINNIEVFEKPRFMTVNQAVEQLLEAEEKIGSGTFTLDTWAIGMARVGQPTQKIASGTLRDLLTVDFGEPLHSLVIPGPVLHPLEIEMFFFYWHDQTQRKIMRDKYVEEQENKRLREVELRLEEQRLARKARLEAMKKAKEHPPTESSEYDEDDEDDEDKE